VDPTIYRIRHDLTWEDVVENYVNEKRFMTGMIEVKEKLIIGLRRRKIRVKRNQVGTPPDSYIEIRVIFVGFLCSCQVIEI
jgi:hypothetical protein